ncbi:serine hydrolase domain-containing protein [Lutimonas zeaxanthinifaciens]|uniref:serine hydrolase domain-containing protein n=1 Tax=Lutimonas zeaxanthinifaciens TaxID=3060215 RepID=UPI00265CB137|nr:serine hydrolase [Lutimonas sp. YSD2104]WKK66748.1 serine hydrolase [Lutimonas sp. YSD2104]
MKGRLKVSLVLVIYIFFVVLSCKEGSAPTVFRPAKKELDINKSLEAVFKKNELMGMSVVLIDEGKLQWNKSFGLANLDHGTRVNSNTMFRVVSISKTVTAIALMQLVDRGLVDLHRDVSDYLGWQLRNPYFPEIPITLYQILNHTSSIADGKGYVNFSRKMISDELAIETLFSKGGTYFTEDLYSKNAPGTYFSYTNASWGIVASVIELLSNLSFDAYCREYIFKPMGIKAEFDPAHLESIDNLAVLYRFEDGNWSPQADNYQGLKPSKRLYDGYELGTNGFLNGPQGNLRASALDLAELILMFFNEGESNGRQILKKESVHTMLGKHWEFDGENGDTWGHFYLSFGLGIHHITNMPESDIIFEDRNMSGHPGIAYGLLSDMYFDSRTRSGIVFITNGSKLKYEYGQESSFYQVEEDLFKAVNPFLKK